MIDLHALDRAHEQTGTRTLYTPDAHGCWHRQRPAESLVDAYPALAAEIRKLPAHPAASTST